MILTKLARPVSPDTFADITTATVTEVKWVDGGLSVVFSTPPTAAEERLIRLRAMSANDTTETLLRQAWTAYQANVGHLATPAPTQAQMAAQVAALTRQMSFVIRLLAPVEV